MAGAADNSRRSLDRGGTAVDRELGFSVEDDEHFFDDVVEMMADARAGRNHAAMQEVELGRHGAPIEQRREAHASGAAVHGGRLTERSRIGVDYPPRRSLLLCGGLRRPERRDGDGEDGKQESSHQFMPSG